MKLTVWGARGSIPVSGPQYVKRGGDTSCLELETSHGEVIILDAGTGLRALGNELLAQGQNRVHFLLTHAHWDHLLGFPFFKPLYRKDTVIQFHGCLSAQESLRNFLKEAMRAPFFPVDLNDVAAKLEFDDACPKDFDIAGVCCESLPMNHPNGGHGFRLSESGKSLVFYPDNELNGEHKGGKSFEVYVEFCRDADALFHDAEYLPEEYASFSRGWGHSVFLDTVRLGIEAEAKRLVCWHLNQDRTDDQVDRMEKEARRAVSDAGSKMACEMARAGLTIEL